MSKLTYIIIGIANVVLLSYLKFHMKCIK